MQTSANADEGRPPELVVWTVYSAEEPHLAPEVELAHALLAHSFGPPLPGARFWDDGLAGYLAARSGRSSYHVEAAAHARQLLVDGLLPPLIEVVAESGARMSARASTAACAFAEYLIDRYGFAQYQRLLQAARTGNANPFERVYRTPLAVVDRDWRRRLEATTNGHAPSLVATLRRLWPLARPYWRPGLAILGCALVSIMFSLALPLSFRFLIDGVLTRRPLAEAVPWIGPSGHVIEAGGEQLEALVKLLAALGVLYLSNAAARLGMNTLLNVVGESFAHDLRLRLVDVIGQLPSSYFARTPAADVSQRVVHDTSTIQQVITRAGVPLLTGGISIILYALLLFSLQMKLALVTLAGLPVLGLIYRLRRRSRRAAARERVRRLADLSGAVNETAAAQVLVKLYSAGAYFRERLLRRLETHRQLNIAFARESSLLSQVAALTIGLTQVAVLLVGGYLVVVSDGRDLAPGSLVAFYIVLNQLLAPIGQVASASQAVAGAGASVDRVSELLAEPTEHDPPDQVELEPLHNAIRFEDVSFAYASDQSVLRHLTLTIPAGATVAFVGPTGAGKSTVAHLLPRLYEPTHGAIAWDGVDLRTARLSALRRQVILIPQDSILLSTTLYENIRFGLKGVSDEQVRQAARLAQAHEFVVGLPQGYDTVVGDRGVGLSGGQRQRIALARALLREPSVLILDEATSALDATTQRAVMDGLRVGAPQRTLVKIAHRLETVVDADVIFVLEDGRLVEQGKHRELLAAGGTYARLFEDQLGSLQAPGELSARQAARRLMRLRPFADVPSRALDALAAALAKETRRAGETIYAQGAESDELYVLARGRADVLVANGAGPRRVRTLHRGAVLSVNSWLSGRPRVATVRASSDVTLFALSRSTALRVLGDLAAAGQRPSPAWG